MVVILAGASMVAEVPRPASATPPILFDVGRDTELETSWTYTDTDSWDSFNDITAWTSAYDCLSLAGGSAVGAGIDDPGTDVLVYDEYIDGDYGRMYVGYDIGDSDVFTYVVDSDAINALRDGETDSDYFGFECDGDVGTFTVNLVGSDDRPNIERALRDITDNQPRTDNHRFPKVPDRSNSAFGFSGDGWYVNTADGERVEKAFDGFASTKYLNFGATNTDVLIDMGAEHIVTGLALVTANDEPDRDPTSVVVFGSNTAFDPVVVQDPFYSPEGDLVEITDWMATATQIGDEVALTAPTGRLTTYPAIELDNPNRRSFRYFRILFPTIRDDDNANSMQIAEIRVIGNKKSSEESFIQGAGAVKINGDTSVKAERPVSARMTIQGALAGDTLTCPDCVAEGYTASWTAGTFVLDIVDIDTTYSPIDIITAIRSVQFVNSAFTGAREVPVIRLTVTDANGLESEPVDFEVVMGLPRSLTIGVASGPAPESLPQGAGASLVSTPSAGGGVVAYRIENGDCSVSGSTLVMGASTCVVSSEISMDGTYQRTFSENQLEIDSVGVLDSGATAPSTSPTTVPPSRTVASPTAVGSGYWIRINRQPVLATLSEGDRGYSLVGGGIVLSILGDQGLVLVEGDRLDLRLAGLEPGSVVRVSVGGRVIGSIAVGANGVARGAIAVRGDGYDVSAQSGSGVETVEVIVRGTRVGGDDVAAMVRVERSGISRLPETGGRAVMITFGALLVALGVLLSRRGRVIA
jgi:VCBS repeat-containing protein